MGLFSSKKKVYVNTTVQKVFAENQIPNSTQTGIFRGILNEGDIVEYMLEETIGSISVKVDAGYSWAVNNYEPGIPSAQVTAAGSARSFVLNTLANSVNGAITPDYYKFGPLNSIHYGFQLLADQYGYNPQTNEIAVLSAQTGQKCYLANMVATYSRKTFDDAVKYSDTGAFEQWGPSPTSGYRPDAPFNTLGSFGQYAPQSVYEVSDTSPDDYITFTYQFEAGGVITNRGLTISMAGLPLDDDYHMVRYKLANGQIRFFTYKDGSGAYPEIDGVQKVDFSEFGTYYPWAYMKYNGYDMTSDPFVGTDWYKDTLKWCKYIGVDWLLLTSAIMEDPDSDDVEQAILMFGVNPAATTAVEKEYLFEYFNLLYLNSSADSDNKDSFVDQFNDYSRSPDMAQVIQDKKFATALVHSGIAKRRVVGKIGDPGTFTSERVVATTQANYMNGGNSERQSAAVSTVTWVYRKQVQPQVYEEVQIFNPGMVYQVTGKKGHAAGPDDPELLIPLDRTIVRQMSFSKKEELLTRSLYMVVNTKIVVKSKWYTSAWFKIVLVVIVIIIVIVTWGGASGIAASLASLAASSATVIALTVITAIVKALVISYVAKLFVKEVGPELGLLAAVIAIVYGGYSSYTAVAGQATWGTTLVAIGSNMSTAVSNQYQDMVADIQQEMTDFANFAKGQFDTLKQKQDDLSLSERGISGLEFVKYEPMIVFGESPNDLYARTVHSGNIGTVSFAAVSEFYNTALRLPTVSQVNGDFDYGNIPA